VSQTTSHESDLPASPLLVERARSHVVLEVEDESLHKSTVDIFGDKLNTLFDLENPCGAFIIHNEIVVVPRDHSIRVVEEERFNPVVLFLIALLVVFFSLNGFLTVHDSDLILVNSD